MSSSGRREAWRTHFANEESLRAAVSLLPLDGVEQRLLTAIVLSGHAGQGDLAGALVCTLTMDELAEIVCRSSRTLRRRESIDRLAPVVEVLARAGTSNMLVCWPARLPVASGERRAEGAEPAEDRDRQSAQRQERRQRERKRPAAGQRRLAPVRPPTSSAGVVRAVASVIGSLFKTAAGPQPETAEQFWGATVPEPVAVCSASAPSVRTDGADIERPSGRTCPDGHPGRAQQRHNTNTNLPPPKELITSPSDGDGDVIFSMRWGRPLRGEQLRDPREVAGPLFRRVCLEGFAHPTEEDLRRFVALVVHVLRQPRVANHVALLTKILDGRAVDKFARGGWRNYPSEDDLRRAKEMLAALEWGQAAGTRSEDAYLAELRREADESADRRRQLAALNNLTGGRKAVVTEPPAAGHDAQPAGAKGGESS